MIGYRIEPEFEKRASIFAKKDHRSTNSLAKHAFEEYVERREIKEKIRLETLAALAECERGETVPHEKVVEWLRSCGTDHESPCPVQE